MLSNCRFKKFVEEKPELQIICREINNNCLNEDVFHFHFSGNYF